MIILDLYAIIICLLLVTILGLIQVVWGQTNVASTPSTACNLCVCCLQPSSCLGNGYCGGQCKEGYFGAKCLNSCPSNCVTCKDPYNPYDNKTLYGVANCTQCKPTYYSTSQYFQCQLTCPPECETCTSYTNCTSCKTGYFQTYSFCNACTVGCSSCSSATKCNHCMDGYYHSGDVSGNNCVRCSNGCQTGTCNKESGSCICNQGFTGNKCDMCNDGWFSSGSTCQRCKVGCKICNTLNTCQQCENGYYMSFSGVECSKCSTGCTKECNSENGSCICKTGFAGEKCDQCYPNFQTYPKCDKCIAGYYGPGCDNHCPVNCKDIDCERFSEKCMNGCNGNFSGDRCNMCIDGWYDKDCTAKCPENCLHGTCNQSTGHCQSCKTNYTGGLCNVCENGQFGNSCDLPCSSNCKDNICNRESGNCDTCIDGYSGDKCCLKGPDCRSCSSDSVCSVCVSTKYGQQCDMECPRNCADEICDKLNGTCNQCITGFTGDFCTLSLRGQEHPTGVSVTAIAVGALGLVIVIVIVVVLAFFIKRRYRDHTPKTIEIASDRVHENDENEADTISRSNPYASIIDLEPPSFGVSWKKEDSIPLHADETADRLDLPQKPNKKLSWSSKTAKASLKAHITSDHPDGVQINNDNECFKEDGESDYYNSEAILEKGIAVGELTVYVNKKDMDFFNKEFKKLPKGLVKPANTASLDHNIGKNRYNEIYPYDETRVVLEGPGTDFINACYIDGYRKKRQYIASFGPIARATERYQTFWRMVWQEKTGKIVMVTNLMENGGMKCEQYWPDKNVTLAYGDVKVTCHSEDVYAEYTVRSFTVRKGKEQRPLLHIHFTAWPDKGVPDDVTSLVEFRNKVNSTKTKLQGPIIVHCSAGVGRTGTYIALDILTNQGKQKGFVDIFACVEKMRQQRTCMVQTAEQYEYLHRALVHTLTLGSDAIPADRLIDYTASLSDAIFGRLSQCTEIVSTDEMEAIARNKELTAYNRYGADIPGDFNRPRLYYDRSPRDNKYINAIFVNSFRLKNQFILTQTPLPNTVDDFLTLVLQENCCCIVSMDPSDPLEKSIGTYLPADNQVLHSDAFDVRSTMLESNRSYIQRALTIKYKVNSSSITVQHFLCANWSKNARTPKSPQEFMTFVKQIQKVADELTQFSPIIVHCLTGSERSALLCVVLSLLQKIEIEHQVSVTNTVRQVKVRRPKAIPNKEQFKFCHQCVSAYLQSFDTYSNFS